MLQNRHFERFRFSSPIEATAGTVVVQLVDVSRTGFKVHHQEAMPPKGEPFTLRFRWNGSVARLQCVTMWTMIHRLARSMSERPTLSSGLRIEAVDASSEGLLDAMIASLSGSAVDAPAVEPYLFCEFANGSWKQIRTARRDQPGEGFTVSAGEDAAQVARLCSAYASGDGETRKLIRTLAALSIKSQSDAQ